MASGVYGHPYFFFQVPTQVTVVIKSPFKHCCKVRTLGYALAFADTQIFVSHFTLQP